MKKVKALLVPLIILGLLTIIVLNIKRESNVEGNTLRLANNNVEQGKVYIEVILWNDGRKLEFINTIWTDFVRDYSTMPQTKIARKECKDMLDFLNTIPVMKIAIDAIQKHNPNEFEKNLRKLCPCVLFLFYDESHNNIKREIIGMIVESNLTKDMLISTFREAYDKPYKDGKTVSEFVTI
jgi:hypothetical protein